jgi:hypothetical protein
MGRARFYVAALATTLVVFAAVGIVHLFSPGRGKLITQLPKGPDAQKTTGSLPEKAVISITEIGVTESKGRNGQLNVALKIGVAPIADATIGEVEIRVAFFDVNAAGELQPTNGQVDYKWITPDRNWSDPSPKYLVATYLSSASAWDRAEQLKYGGFLVRVYFNGRLQAERSDPKELVASLRNRPAPASRETKMTTPTPRPIAAKAPTAEPQPFETPRTITRISPSASPVHAGGNNSESLPYASPVPDKPGFVYSPYNPKFLIDVRGFPPGTEVTDPNTSKRFKVP